jgi:hypothetical protein
MPKTFELRTAGSYKLGSYNGIVDAVANARAATLKGYTVWIRQFAGKANPALVCELRWRTDAFHLSGHTGLADVIQPILADHGQEGGAVVHRN